jgi:2'-5' RNA ligase
MSTEEIGAMSDLFLNSGGSRLPHGALLGERWLPGTVYFAVKPEPDTVDPLVSVGNRAGVRHGLLGSVSPAVLHMTICPIGYLPELPDERIEEACKIGERFVEKQFEIVWDRIRTYPNGREKQPLVAFASNGAPKAKLFRHALITDLKRCGFIFPRQLPDPHVTLFYDRHIVAEEPIEPIRWIVRDFVLVHSIYGQGRHRLLGHWPLRG